MTFQITPRARADLISIGRYTQKNWGTSQRNAYLKSLDARFAWLADNPHLGKHRPEIDARYYSFREGSHMIFYMIEKDYIAIIGLPHVRMDIDQFFS